MRVGVVLEQLLAEVPGGTGRYSLELSAALARTAVRGDTVTGWTAWRSATSAASVDGVLGPRRLVLPRRPLVAAWERGFGPAPRDAEIVHAPTPLLPPRRGRPLVVTIHDTVPWTHPETLTSRGAQWHRTMAARAVRSGAVITVPTAAVADELSSVLPGLDTARVRVLGAGVARSLLAPADDDRVDHLALPQRYLVTVSTLEPRKGLDVLVAALALMGTDRLPLVVVGPPGWGGVDLAGAARQAGLPPDAVRATGRIADGTLAGVLQRATALIAPSRAEGFDLPVAEAMAVGIPVVGSDLPVHREVAGDAALLFRTGDAAALSDAITRLVADPDLRERLVERGLKRSRAFDWDDVARRAWTLYRELVGPV